MRRSEDRRSDPQWLIIFVSSRLTGHIDSNFTGASKNFLYRDAMASIKALVGQFVDDRLAAEPDLLDTVYGPEGEVCDQFIEELLKFCWDEKGIEWLLPYSKMDAWGW